MYYYIDTIIKRYTVLFNFNKCVTRQWMNGFVIGRFQRHSITTARSSVTIPDPD